MLEMTRQCSNFYFFLLFFSCLLGNSWAATLSRVTSEEAVGRRGSSANGVVMMRVVCFSEMEVREKVEKKP